MKNFGLAINTALMSDSRPIEGGTSEYAYTPRAIAAFISGKTADLFLGAHEILAFYRDLLRLRLWKMVEL